MRIGYLLDVHGGPYDQPMPDRDDVARKLDWMIEEGIAAERHGYHSVMVPHRHGRTETYFPGPTQALTILARETAKVALGTFTYVSTLFHPMLAAEQFAVIDNLSRGRLFVSMARGYHEGYWKFFGASQERLLGRHLEAVQVMKRAIEGERFSFDGEFWQVEDSILAPQPYQRDGFPIWGAGDSPPAMLRAASYGLAWCCSPFPLTKEQWDTTVGRYRERCRELGKEPYVVLMRDGWVASSFEEAAEVFGRHYVEEMLFYQRQGVMAHIPGFEDESAVTAENLRAHAVMGSPADCIEQLERYESEFEVDYVVMRFRMPTGRRFRRHASRSGASATRWCPTSMAGTRIPRRIPRSRKAHAGSRAPPAGERDACPCARRPREGAHTRLTPDLFTSAAVAIAASWTAAASLIAARRAASRSAPSLAARAWSMHSFMRASNARCRASSSRWPGSAPSVPSRMRFSSASAANSDGHSTPTSLQSAATASSCVRARSSLTYGRTSEIRTSPAYPTRLPSAS